jgi:formylmethanofuran dehydrogenase subunit E
MPLPWSRAAGLANALKFRDWGKMAATFIDVSTGKAIRIAAKVLEGMRPRDVPGGCRQNQQQMRAYREMPEDELFTLQWVKVNCPKRNCLDTRAPASSAQHVAKGSTFAARSKGRKTLCRSCQGEATTRQCLSPEA